MASNNKSNKSALVIIPPEKVWTQIQNIRRVHDKHFQRWMPHINLLYPFLPDTGDIFEKAAGKLGLALAAFAPFRVRFSKDSFESFQHGRSCTMWLKPIPVQLPPPKKPVVHKKLSGTNRKQFSKIQSSTVKTHPMMTPVSQTITNQSTPSLDNLRDATWTPENTKDANIASDSGFDSLRNAFWEPGMVNNMGKKPVANEQLHHPQSKTFSVISERKEEVTSSSSDEQDDDASWDNVLSSENDEQIVEHLQEVLQNVLPECDDLQTISVNGFQPHLSLGQFASSKIDSQIAQFKNHWCDIEFDVSEIYMISRKDFHDPFTIKKTIPFGSLLS